MIVYLFTFFRLWGLFALASFFFSLLISVSSFNIFKASGKNYKYSFIPFYNILDMLDITKISRYTFILFLLPVVNVLIIFYMLYRISIVFNTSKLIAYGLILLPIIFLPVLNYSMLNKTESKKEKVDSFNLMTDEEIYNLNNDKSDVVDNVFKSKVKVEVEEVPYFKATNTVKYREMMLSDNEADSIKKFEPVTINSIKNDNNLKEDDSIEIVEL